MRFKRRSASLVAAAMGALILAPIQPPSAFANTAVAKNTTLSVSTASLILFASATQTYTNTGVQFTTIVTNGARKNFYINNSGNFSLSRFTLTITLPASSNVSTFRRCNVNVDFSGPTTCASGSTTNVTITPGSAVTYTLPTTPNSFYVFQIVQNKTGTMKVDVTANTAFITTGVSNS
ncbi:hypothetical protein MCEMRE196_01434 [Candidatus Nanopelagicaceae bacterium]